MIKVKTEIEVQEVDDKTVPTGSSRPALTVESHWSNGRLTVVSFGDKKVSVFTHELETAIKNARRD